MRLLLIIVVVLTVSSLLAADGDFKKTESGLKYKIIEEGNGEKPEKEDIVSVHYKGELENGKVFDSSYKRGKPIEFPLGTGRVIKGWDEGIALLSKGAKAIFVIPPELGYGNRPAGPIPPNSTLIFTVELVDFKKGVKVEQYKTENLKLHETESGLKYYIVKEGNGEKPFPGAKVQVHYSGYLKNGNLFDSSVKRGRPFSFSLGRGRVIKGWDEGVALMKKGAKYKFIIPSELGYGKRGTGPIPPNAELIFDVELIDFN